jgi:hypothetical protein
LAPVAAQGGFPRRGASQFRAGRIACLCGGRLPAGRRAGLPARRRWTSGTLRGCV